MFSVDYFKLFSSVFGLYISGYLISSSMIGISSYFGY